ALEYAVDSCIPEHALVRVWLHISPAARHLDHLVRGAPDQVARENLGDSGFQRDVRVSLVCRRRKLPQHRVCRIYLTRQLSELALRDLEGRDRLPELHAPLCVA